MGKVLVVLSGGQDSTTCLFLAKKRGAELHAITFDYGQRHVNELHAARQIAQMAGCVSHEILELGSHILKSTSPLVSDNKLEQYKDHQSLPGGLEKTFVPMRNQLFLTIAMNRAVEIGTRVIVTGVCQEDYGGYPDCREYFIHVLQDASNIGLGLTGEDGIDVWTPLMNMTKKQSVELALDTEGCYEALAYSHTSYDGRYPPTGRDHATLLRAKGFEEANVPDPLILRAWHEGLMDLPATKNYHSAHFGEFMKLVGLK